MYVQSKIAAHFSVTNFVGNLVIFGYMYMYSTCIFLLVVTTCK